MLLHSIWLPPEVVLCLPYCCSPRLFPLPGRRMDVQELSVPATRWFRWHSHPTLPLSGAKVATTSCCNRVVGNCFCRQGVTVHCNGVVSLLSTILLLSSSIFSFVSNWQRFYRLAFFCYKLMCRLNIEHWTLNIEFPFCVDPHDVRDRSRAGSGGCRGLKTRLPVCVDRVVKT